MNHRSIIKKIIVVSAGVFVLLSIYSCKGSSNSNSGFFGSKKDADVNALYSGFYQNPSSIDEKQQNEIIEYAVDNNLPLERLESGVYYMITQDGKGPTLRWGEKIKVHYKGYYIDGNEFDSSYKRGEPLTTSVGQSIAGWTEVLIRMKTESKCTVLIPSRLAYGEEGFPAARIPPNMILAFDIHVLF